MVAGSVPGAGGQQPGRSQPSSGHRGAAIPGVLSSAGSTQRTQVRYRGSGVCNVPTFSRLHPGAFPRPSTCTDPCATEKIAVVIRLSHLSLSGVEPRTRTGCSHTPAEGMEGGGGVGGAHTCRGEPGGADPVMTELLSLIASSSTLHHHRAARWRGVVVSWSGSLAQSDAVKARVHRGGEGGVGGGGDAGGADQTGVWVFLCGRRRPCPPPSPPLRVAPLLLWRSRWLCSSAAGLLSPGSSARIGGKSRH